MSPVSGGITLKRSHAYRPGRAFLNQWTGPERPFQHTLKQGHLTEMQVCGSATRRGEEEEQGDADVEGGGSGLHVSALFTIPCENVPFHHCIPMCICPYVFVFPGSGENTYTVLGHDMLSHIFVWRDFKVTSHEG